MSSQEEKTWGTFAHIIPLLVTTFTSFGWVAALVIYLVHKDKSRFVAFHALQELYFMVAMWVLAIAGLILFFTVIGIPIALLLWVVSGFGAIIGPIIAAVKANNGEWWEYPVIGKMAKSAVGA